MDMGLTVVVVLVVLAVIAAVTLLALQGRRRRQEQQRIEAAEHRHEAEIRSASAERREAEASERAARAEREQAQAHEQAARARQDREAAEERHAAADRVDPDHRTDDPGRDTAGPAGHDTADPAARTEDLRLDADDPAPASEGRHVAAPAHTDGTSRGPQPSRPQAGSMPDRPSDGPSDGPGRHAAAPPSAGGDADPSARTDDLRLGERREGDQGQTRVQDQTQGQSAATENGGGWHGPTASGGFRAVDPAGEPDVPVQRTGEHDSDRRETAEGEPGGEHGVEHSGVRGLADRLLRRRGS
jgi:hypothetical protein